MNYDNGWYGICGVQNKRCNVHYFYKDKIIHVLHSDKQYSRKYTRKITEEVRCKVCESILRAYARIGLDHRLI